jgi:hypothetical protein
MMEDKPTRSKVNDLFNQFDYTQGLSLSNDISQLFEIWQGHKAEDKQALSDYGEEESLQLMALVDELSGSEPHAARQMLKVLAQARNSGLYSTHEIDKSLEAALRSPFGRLMLERILYILAVEDHPSKLKELTDNSDREESHRVIGRMLEEGLAPQEIARRINGTYHTGYVEDLRVAEKVEGDAGLTVLGRSRTGGNFKALEKVFYKFI